ncbi:LOW QUALITY PROTEIN: uncharacterized protein C4orf17 homolog [Aegotheles albertisi]
MWKYNRHSAQSRCSGGKYCFSRNIPHTRMVCHIPGLNNAPVCVVRNSFSREHPSAGNTVIPEQEDDQEHVLTGNTASNACANYLPKLKGFMGTELDTPWSVTQVKPFLYTSFSILEKNRQGIHAMPLTQPSSPFANLHCGPCIQENVSHLDRGIKVLQNLSKILQTDSLTEIQKWFARASKKEKDFVCSLIYSEQTEKGMLNSKDGTAENMNIQSLLNPLPLLQRGPEGERNQSRSSAKESVTSQNMKQEREKECLLLFNAENRGPAQADTLFPRK